MNINISKLEVIEPINYKNGLEYEKFLCQHMTGKKQGQYFIYVSASSLIERGNRNYFNNNRDRAIEKIK